MKPAIAAILLFSLAVALTPASARQKESPLRTVEGTVVDKQDNVLPRAVVYLLNTRTQVIRTYISTDGEGLYRFSGLDPNVDFDIHAELNGLTSIVRTVSSFDTRKDIVLILKVDREKKSGK